MASTKPAAAKPPKVMSSRLMGLKFMQRAAAVPQEAATSDLEKPPKKRKRVSEYSVSNNEAIRAELALEEARRAEAIERQAALVGETRWIFSVQGEGGDAGHLGGQGGSHGLRFVTAGYASIDEVKGSADATQEDTVHSLQQRNKGRKRYGQFKPEMEEDVPNESASDDESLSDPEDEPSGDDPFSDAKALVREARMEAKRIAKQERRAAATANACHEGENDEPGAKKVKLNKLSAISGVKVPTNNMICYQCGGKGHSARECTIPAPEGKRTIPSPEVKRTIPAAKEKRKTPAGEDMICFGCGGKGHPIRECTMRVAKAKRAMPAAADKRNVPTPEDTICFRCGGKGHFIRQCPNSSAEVKRTIAAVEVKRPNPAEDMICYGCGGKGHPVKQCPIAPAEVKQTTPAVEAKRTIPAEDMICDRCGGKGHLAKKRPSPAAEVKQTLPAVEVKRKVPAEEMICYGCGGIGHPVKQCTMPTAEAKSVKGHTKKH